MKIGLFINIIQRSFRLTTLISSLLETSTTSSRTRRGLHYLRRAAEPVDTDNLGALHECTPNHWSDNVIQSPLWSNTKRSPLFMIEHINTDNLGALHEVTPTITKRSPWAPLCNLTTFPDFKNFKNGSSICNNNKYCC